MCKVTTVATGTRPGFVDTHPELRDAHLTSQRAMFKAARDAGLSWSRDLQIRGMNEALGLRGDARVQSRRELSITQMKAITTAIEADLFSDDWTWGHDFTISITTRVVMLDEVHFAPRGDRYERMAANCAPLPEWMQCMVHKS